MASITIRFVTGSDVVSRVIRDGEMGFWASHVECLMPDGTLLGAHTDGGVQARARDYDSGRWTRELWIDAPCSDAQADTFHAFLVAQIGKPYDHEAIIAMARGALEGLATLADNGGAAWICSALIVAALLSAGLVKSAPSTVRLTTPRDVLQMLAALVAIGAPQSPAVALAPASGRPGAATSFDPFGA